MKVTGLAPRCRVQPGGKVEEGGDGTVDGARREGDQAGGAVGAGEEDLPSGKVDDVDHFDVGARSEGHGVLPQVA